MFAETLLESSPTARKRKRWPMATAFTVETIIAAVLGDCAAALHRSYSTLGAGVSCAIDADPYRTRQTHP